MTPWSMQGLDLLMGQDREREVAKAHAASLASSQPELSSVEAQSSPL